MKRTPLYAILSGFQPNDIPGIGTFYDFFKRLWDANSNNLKPKRQKKRKRKPKKGKKVQKAPTVTPGRVKRLVEWLLRHEEKKTSLPSDKLFYFFQTQILSISESYGLLGSINAPSVAGDVRLLPQRHIPEVNLLVIVVPKASLNATMIVFIPNPTATQAGIAPEKNITTVITSI